jgi:hypothetical protein
MTEPSTGQRIRFVDHPADAGSPDPAMDVVVLDTAWTPAGDDRANMAPVRHTLHDILARVEFHDELERSLDRWAAAVGAVDRFKVGDVSWWYRVRLLIQWDLHERMIWCHVLRALVRDDHTLIEVPSTRPALIDAARAMADGRSRLTVEVVEPPPVPEPPPPAWTVRRVLAGFRRRLRRRIRPPRPRKVVLAERRAVVEARMDRILEDPGSILVIESARAAQVVTTGDRDEVEEPFLGPGVRRLHERGIGTTSVVLGADHRADADWQLLVTEDRTLPQAAISLRFLPADGELQVVDRSTAWATDVPSIQIMVAGIDLGPSILAMARSYASGWLGRQVVWFRRAEAFLSSLRPRAIFLDREDSRLVWMAAAHDLGIPVVAVQHGLIYPGHTTYRVPDTVGVTRPDCTCVFGTYERDVLVRDCYYDPTSVIVTGSPRAEPGDPSWASSATERDGVRRALGVAASDRLLVVSVVHNPVAGDIYSVEMVARLLGGPLPGVHVVFKLHPQETGATPFEAVLAGLARAGRYDPPPMTSIRDIDLYRLLRSADAHLGLYSTVLTDAVVVGLPNLIATGQAFSDLLGYVPAGVATPVSSIEELRAAMADPRPPDPERRTAFLADHFEPGDAAGRIADVIGQAARIDATAETTA